MSKAVLLNKALFVIVWVLVTHGVVAKAIEVKAFVEPKSVHPQNSITLTVLVQQEASADVEVQIPDFKDFEITGRSTSQSVSFTFGQTTREKRYHYTLQPRHEGRFTIGPIEVIVAGKVHTTKAVSVEVSSKVAPQAKRKSLSPFFNMPRHFWNPFLDPDSGSDRGNSLEKRDILFRLELEKNLDRHRWYIGELVVAHWVLYVRENRLNPISAVLSEPSEVSGFWVESLFQSTGALKSMRGTKRLQGVDYRRYLLASVALAPLHAGVLKIGSAQMTVQLVLGGGGFFNRTRSIQKKSQELEVKVVSLPKVAQGSMFTGAVGDFSLSANVSRSAMSAGDSFIYKLVLKGQGHPRFINLPSLDFGSSLKMYDRTESQKFSLARSVKEYEMIIIPQKAGRLKVPSFELSTFDPQLGVYKVHIVPSFLLAVKKGILANKGRGRDELHTNKTHSQNELHSTRETHSDILLSPRTLDEGEAQLGAMVYHRYRGVFWFVAFSLLFFSFLWLMGRRFLLMRGKTPWVYTMQDFQKSIDKASDAQDWQKAGALLLDLVYAFLSTIVKRDKAIKNLDILLQDLPPRVRGKYELAIRELSAYLDRLSFAPVETGASLRNKKSVTQLKNRTYMLLKEITYFCKK